MRFEVIDGRWHFGFTAGLPVVADIWFNHHRKIEKPPKRSRIGKEHNYKFNFKNR